MTDEPRRGGAVERAEADRQRTDGVGLLDTSVFIASETHRPLDAGRLPQSSAVSAVTIGELGGVS